MNYKDDFPILKNRDIAYLDSGATTQKPIQVIKTLEEFYENNKPTIKNIEKDYQKVLVRR